MGTLPITIRIRAQRNTVWGFRTSLRLPWLPRSVRRLRWLEPGRQARDQYAPAADLKDRQTLQAEAAPTSTETTWLRRHRRRRQLHNSNYNSLQAVLSVENKHGFTLHLAIPGRMKSIFKATICRATCQPVQAKYDRGAGTLTAPNFHRQLHLRVSVLPTFRHCGGTRDIGRLDHLRRNLFGKRTPATIGWVVRTRSAHWTSNRPTQTGKVSYSTL